MPFALLAVGLALNLYLGRRSRPAGMGLLPWLNQLLAGERPLLARLELAQWLGGVEFWLAALVLGGLAFLNTWNFPIYVGLFTATYVLVRYQQDGWRWRRVGELIELGAALGLAGIVLYLPFYTGFASQAGGILPSLSYFTRGIYFWIMFVPLLLPLWAWFIWLWRQQGERPLLRQGLKFALIVVGGFWLFSYFLGVLAANLSAIGSSLLASQAADSRLGQLATSMVQWGGLLLDRHGSSNATSLLLDSLARRMLAPGTWLTLLGMLTFIWAFLIASDRRQRLGSCVCIRSGGRWQRRWSLRAGCLRPAAGFGGRGVDAGAGVRLSARPIRLADEHDLQVLFRDLDSLGRFGGVCFDCAVESVKIGVGPDLSPGVGGGVDDGLGLPGVWAEHEVQWRERGQPQPGWQCLHRALHSRRSGGDGLVATGALWGSGRSQHSRGELTSYGRFRLILACRRLWAGRDTKPVARRGGEMGSRQDDLQRLYQTTNWTGPKRCCSSIMCVTFTLARWRTAPTGSQR